MMKLPKPLIYPYEGYDQEETSDEELQDFIENEKERLKNDQGRILANKVFNDPDGNPLELTPGQIAIWNLITKRQCRFSELVCSTQYGKTFVVSLAVALRAASFAEDWLIIVPDMKRGIIFMDYIQKACARNDYLAKKLISKDFGSRNALTRMLEEKSKTKLTFQVPRNDGSGRVDYGSIKIITAEARRVSNTISSIMGFGGKNIVFEEASMSDDNIAEGVFRMITGRGKDTFLLKLGNPWFRNHFHDTWVDPTFYKIFIDYRIGIAEGRYQKEDIERARKNHKRNFSVLWECKFPKEEAIDNKGYMNLVTKGKLDNAMQEVPHGARQGVPRIGLDISRQGANYNVWVIRWDNYAEILARNRDSDLMSVANTTIDLAKRNDVKSAHIFVDDTGVGGGVTDRLRQLNFPPRAVTLANKVKGNYINKRSQNFMRLKEWIETKGSLCPDNDWSDLIVIKHKEVYRSGEQQTKIMSKEDMRTSGIMSPDVADALMLTFDLQLDRSALGEMNNEYEEHNFDPHSAI